MIESRRTTNINWSSAYVGTIYHEEIKNKAKLEAKEFDMSQATSKEENAQKIAKLLEKTPAELAYLQGTEEEPAFFVYNRTLLEQDGDSLEQLQKYRTKTQYLKDNIPLPSDDEFSTALNKLTKEMKNILVDFYQSNGNSNEFKELLHSAVETTYAIKSREEEQQNLLNLLKQLPKGNNKEQTQAFLCQLTGNTFKTEQPIEEMFKRSKEDIGLLVKYAGANLDLEMFLESFFRLANLFGAIPESSKAKIQDSLQSAQRYLYNQSGRIDTSFKVGDYVISFNEDPMSMEVLDGSGFSIAYQKSDELLTSLASSFDSTQSFLDILDKREQLEKQNQELQNKQSFNGIPSIKVDSTSDSLMQALLKEARDSKVSD